MPLHRPYIRKDVRAEVEAKSNKNEDGNYLDANTGKVIEGKYDLGHVAGHEFRKERAIAEKEGLTQGEFNDKMNDPELYQIEDPHSNRSHIFEAKDPQMPFEAADFEDSSDWNKSGSSSMGVSAIDGNNDESMEGMTDGGAANGMPCDSGAGDDGGKENSISTESASTGESANEHKGYCGIGL